MSCQCEGERLEGCGVIMAKESREVHIALGIIKGDVLWCVCSVVALLCSGRTKTRQIEEACAA
jgi:hypothetical protein